MTNLKFGWRISTTRDWNVQRSARCGLLLMVLCVTPPHVFAQGGGVVIYETGSVDMAHAAAGAGARAQDAATAFYNPAGMTLLDESQVMVGTMAVFSELRLDMNNNKSVSNPPVPQNTDGGGYQSQFTPGLGSFGVLRLTDDLRFGISINALSAAGVDYDRDWIGSTFVTKNQVIVANLMPSLGYRVIDWLSLGTGLNVLYTSLDQELQASSAPDAPTIKIDQADDWALAGTFALMFEPGKLVDVEFLERTRIGVVYRSEANFDLSGDLLNPSPVNLEVEADWTIPQGVNVSIFHQLTPRLALLADAGWSDWSAFDRQGLDVGVGGPTIPRNWEDTWRVGIGAIYEPWDTWFFRGGFSYDSSPVDDNERLPDIPVGEQFRFSVGVGHDFGQGKTVGLGYTLLYQPMDMDEVALPGGVIVDGDYDKAIVHMVGLSLNVAFGGPPAPPAPAVPPAESPAS